MYILIVFQDLEQQQPLYIACFDRIKDIIKFSDGVIQYTDSYYKPPPKQKTKNKTIKKLFKIFKI
jgi:hypothetical protein